MMTDNDQELDAVTFFCQQWIRLRVAGKD
jgi:hypothetical protein